MPKPAQLTLHLSNRLESLAENCLACLEHNPAPPLVKESITVQSRGMAHWLTYLHSRRNGVSMQVEFPFPQKSIQSLLQLFVRDWPPAEQDPYQRDALAFRILGKLPQWTQKHACGGLQRFLQSESPEASARRSWYLAQQIAGMFDQLMVYRPDLLAEWEAINEHKQWQSFIWRELRQELRGAPCLIDHLQDLEGFENPQINTSSLPLALYWFCPGTLPPVYVKLLLQASRYIPVHLFSLSPSPMYLGDVIGAKEQMRLSIAEPRFDFQAHPWLAQWGRQSQELLDLLTDAEIYTDESSEIFQSPAPSNLLGQVQSILFEATPVPATENRMLATPDASLQVHICHGPSREVEVLQQYLLGLLNDDPDLKPEEILVLTQDIQSFAPYIHAVFGQDDLGTKYIPYSVADVPFSKGNQLLEGLNKLLAFLNSRFEASQTLALLDDPCLSNRFPFTDLEYQTIREWLKASAVRWGLDAEQRRKQGGGQFESFTWKQGLERLLLAYAAGDDISSWCEVIPAVGPTTSQTECFNRLLEFITMLDLRYQESRLDRDFTSWLDWSLSWARSLLVDQDEHYRELIELSQCVDKWKQSIAMAGHTDKVSYDTFLAAWNQLMQEDSRAGGFFSGGITFCSLKPLRNIPAKVVCILGMDEQSFPRKEPRSEFDLSSYGKRRPGDRSVRDDDRQLFLDLVLSCRKALYFSYSGIDPRSLEEKPPSILLDELLDGLDAHCVFPEGKSVRGLICHVERLQAHHPTYFDPLKPKSFNEEEKAAAEAVMSQCKQLSTTESPSVFEEPPPLPSNEVDLNSWVKLFKNPSKYFFEKALALRIASSEEETSDDEPLLIDGLGRYQLGSAILTGENHEAQRYPDLPVGALGIQALADIKQKAQHLLKPLQERGWPKPDQQLQVSVSLDELTLYHQIDLFKHQTSLYVRPGSLRSIDRIQAWLSHLMLYSIHPELQVCTYCGGYDTGVHFPPLSGAYEELRKWKAAADQARQGFLPFYPEASYLFANPSKRSKKSPLDQAKGVFESDGQFNKRLGERYDPWINLWASRIEDPLSEEFRHWAQSLLQPMVECQKEGMPV